MRGMELLREARRRQRALEAQVVAAARAAAGRVAEALAQDLEFEALARAIRRGVLRGHDGCGGRLGALAIVRQEDLRPTPSGPTRTAGDSASTSGTAWWRRWPRSWVIGSRRTSGAWGTSGRTRGGPRRAADGGRGRGRRRHDPLRPSGQLRRDPRRPGPIPDELSGPPGGPAFRLRDARAPAPRPRGRRGRIVAARAVRPGRSIRPAREPPIAMCPPRFRTRTLMLAVVIVAVAWGSAAG